MIIIVIIIIIIIIIKTPFHTWFKARNSRLPDSLSVSFCGATRLHRLLEEAMNAP